jgi:hypothetical protein
LQLLLVSLPASLDDRPSEAVRPRPNVDKRILTRTLSGVALARINLNVSWAMRRRLQAVAKRRKKTESEVARDLLVEGLVRREKEAFYERVSQQMTPELRARLLEIAQTFERLDG